MPYPFSYPLNPSTTSGSDGKSFPTDPTPPPSDRSDEPEDSQMTEAAPLDSSPSPQHSSVTEASPERSHVTEGAATLNLSSPGESIVTEVSPEKEAPTLDLSPQGQNQPQAPQDVAQVPPHQSQTRGPRRSRDPSKKPYERRHQCRVCLKSFTRTSTLRAHVVSYHSLTPCFIVILLTTCTRAPVILPTS
jgi:hypothetical protein